MDKNPEPGDTVQAVAVPDIWNETSSKVDVVVTKKDTATQYV